MLLMLTAFFLLSVRVLAMHEAQVLFAHCRRLVLLLAARGWWGGAWRCACLARSRRGRAVHRRRWQPSNSSSTMLRSSSTKQLCWSRGLTVAKVRAIRRGSSNSPAGGLAARWRASTL